jgi:alkylhydroperoxidase/carboxymuconolactone decarboxylase family protein YurZ
MEKAFSLGATEDEIFNTILISSAVCETSSWAYAFRELKNLREEESRSSK